MRSGISAIAGSERRLLGWQALAAVILSLGAAGIGWWLGQTPDDRAILIARYTARVSLGLFLITYISGPLVRGWPSPATRALDREWARWVAAFLIAHMVHFATMIYLLADDLMAAKPRVLIFGTLAYVMPLVMVLTFPRGASGWQKWLRRISLHYVWLSFAVTYYHRLFSHPDRHEAGVFAFTLLAGALAIRLVAAMRTGRWLPRDEERPHAPS